MAHHKSSSSKGHGSSHGKSHGGSSGGSSGGKKQYVSFEVWYCDFCHNGPLNTQTDTHCTNYNCGHRRCHTCQTSVVTQRADH
ncbi:hypothetical protein CORC01_01386 [Colletotrichum orchidophilum]|uniref:Uncharacterized protein n=1 Tax=Colletotrichum orchidophilum TaxID=1209926 RepID=A0A1G4BPV2_9PEZI|nr:uncharacterized protein CORC01_01386 [Colletotrichum orchidophilum]OHF03333.1 hypothetical protein CORC01_01386 [Colletotrichum orchidophilum]